MQEDAEAAAQENESPEVEIPRKKRAARERKVATLTFRYAPCRSNPN